MLKVDPKTIELAEAGVLKGRSNAFVQKLAHDVFPSLIDRYSLPQIEAFIPIQGPTSAALWQVDTMVLKVYFEPKYFAREVMGHALHRRLNPEVSYPVLIAGNGILLMPHLGDILPLTPLDAALVFDQYHQKLDFHDGSYYAKNIQIRVVKTVDEIHSVVSSLLEKSEFLSLFHADLKMKNELKIVQSWDATIRLKRRNREDEYLRLGNNVDQIGSDSVRKPAPISEQSEQQLAQQSLYSVQKQAATHSQSGQISSQQSSDLTRNTDIPSLDLAANSDHIISNLDRNTERSTPNLIQDIDKPQRVSTKTNNRSAIASSPDPARNKENLKSGMPSVALASDHHIAELKASDGKTDEVDNSEENLPVNADEFKKDKLESSANLLDRLPLCAYELSSILEQKIERSANWIRPEYKLPASLFDNARSCLNYLSAVSAPHLILGDASKMNILQSNGVTSVIDYNPVIGDPDYDLAYYIYKLRLGNDKIIPAWQSLKGNLSFNQMQKIVAWMTVISADNMVSVLHHKRNTIKHVQGELLALRELQELSNLKSDLGLS